MNDPVITGEGVELAPGVTVLGPMRPGYADILSTEALTFVALLERRFALDRKQLLAAREERQDGLDRGEVPMFPPETDRVRRGNWRVEPAPADLRDRRVEITGPVERKMMINGLNSGANVLMADLEDSLAPTWANVVEGQINLCDAVADTISYRDPDSGKDYRLGVRPATLVVRPRGWHLGEAHVLVDGAPVSASLFDFALYLFHNVRALRAKGSGPYYYLPKLESYREARLWANVFGAAEEHLALRRGTIRVTVLIETILAAFEMDEILYELRDYATGLNCGRWDYIFSFIKKFRNRSDFVLPDRNAVTMTVPFLRAYSQHLIRTCHKRGAHAMGGMAAFIPIKADAEANETAIAKVRDDKEREASDGHDGTWVAHPGLVAIAREVFDIHMPGPDQLDKMREDVHVGPRDLLAVPTGAITEEGLRNNIRVAVQYIEAWLGGNGCVPLYNLMEDAATAEICRSQIWQWVRHGATLDDGRAIDKSMVGTLLESEMAALRGALGDDRFASGHFNEAVELFLDLATAPHFVDFLTEPAYRRLCAAGG